MEENEDKAEKGTEEEAEKEKPDEEKEKRQGHIRGTRFFDNLPRLPKMSKPKFLKKSEDPEKDSKTEEMKDLSAKDKETKTDEEDKKKRDGEGFFDNLKNNVPAIFNAKKKDSNAEAEPEKHEEEGLLDKAEKDEKEKKESEKEKEDDGKEADDKEAEEEKKEDEEKEEKKPEDEADSSGGGGLFNTLRNAAYAVPALFSRRTNDKVGIYFSGLA